MIRSGWLTAHVSYPARERPIGTVVPWKSNLLGAENVQTTQMMPNATATIDITMDRPAGIRAK